MEGQRVEEGSLGNEDLRRPGGSVCWYEPPMLVTWRRGSSHIPLFFPGGEIALLPPLWPATGVL